MSYDGTIQINTTIDTSSVDQDIKTLGTNLETITETSLINVSNKSADHFKKVMENAQTDTSATFLDGLNSVWYSLVTGVGELVPPLSGFISGSMDGLYNAIYMERLDAIEKMREQADAYYKESQGILLAAQNQKSAFDTVKASCKETSDAYLSQINSIDSLKTALDSQVDANGKIIGSKEEVLRITDQINALAPNTFKVTGNEIEGYQNAKSSLDQLIQSQKARAVLEANQPAYNHAKENFIALAQEETELEKARMDQMDVLSVTLGDLKEAENDYQFALLAGEDAAKGQKKIYDEKKALYDTELASLNNIIEAQDINVENQKAYSETIKQIDEARVAAQEGNYEKALGIMSTYETGLKNAHTGTLSELKTQYQETQTSYNNILQMVKDKGIELAPAQQQALDQMLNTAYDQLVIKAGEMGIGVSEIGDKLGIDMIATMPDGIKTGAPAVNAAVEDVAIGAGDTGIKLYGNYGNAGAAEYGTGFNKGAGELDLSPVLVGKVNDMNQASKKEAGSGATETVDTWFSSANRNASNNYLDLSQYVKQSSDDTVDVSKEGGQKAGQEYAQGIIEGVQEKTGEVTEAIKTMAQTVESNSNEAVKTIAKPLGGALVNGIELGATDQQGPLNSKIQQIVRNAIEAGRIEAGVNSPSKVTRDEIGKPLVQGLVKGIGLEQKNLNKSMGGLLNNMLKSGKSTMGIHSPSTVMRDEVGKYLVYGIRDGIDKNSEAAVEEFQTLLKKLKSQRDLDIINEDEYYTELEKLRDAYFKEGTEEWVQYTTEIYDYQQKLQEEQKKTIIDTYQTMVDEADKAISELEKKQENFEKKLQQNDYFFVTHTLKDIDGNEVGKLGELRDFSDEIEKINQYNDAIDKAQARLGDSAQGQAVYEALLDMDMEQGKLFADTLINASDAELQEYLKSYQEYQNAIKQASREEFAGEWAELESQYGGMYQRLEQTIIDTFGEIPEEFLENGKLSAEQFGDGFLEKLTEVQSKLDSGAMGIKLADETALQQQRSDGQAAGEAFSQGLVQSEQAIQTAGSSLKDKLIEQFGSVPDDFFAIGQDSANSFCEGFMEKLQSAFAAIQNAVTAGMQSMAPSLALAGGYTAGSVSTYHNNYNFYGSGQTVSQQLREARASADLQKLRNL